MSDYKKLLHEKSVRSALVKRDASALELNNIAAKLKGLKDKPFNPFAHIVLYMIQKMAFSYC